MHAFTADRCLAPAAALQDLMDDAGTGLPALVAAAMARLPRCRALPLIVQVLSRAPLHAAHAAVLEAGTGVPARAWLVLERNYRESLAEGLVDTSAG